MENLMKPLTEREIDSLSKADLARFIDHTMLKANAVTTDIEKLCNEAKRYGFCSVCVNSCRVPLAANALRGTGIGVCTVVGFPLGAMSSASKAFEASEAVANGATEVDMVLNVGALKAGETDDVYRDIKAVREATKGKALLKVIIETCLLSDEEKVMACRLSVKAGADFVKTSTGFSTAGAKVEDIALMRRTVGPDVGVKASGGIRTAEDAVAMLRAGATRIGCGAGVAIIA
jgi:deoxyribose-phosphate aldolase